MAEATMTNMVTGTVGTHAAPDAAPVEAPAEAPAAPAPEVKPERPGVDRFAALARKEAELVRKQQAFRSQQAEIARQAEEVRAFQQFREQARTNPLEALKALGISYDDVTSYVLNDNKPTPELEIGSLKQEIEALKRNTAAERERMLEEQRRAAMTEQQQIVEAFREEVGEYISQHAETYELTSLYGGSSLVADVIEEHFRNTNKLLTIPEAAKLVEEHYEDLARKAQATKKFAATQQKVAQAQGVAQPAVPRTGPTLTNNLSATAATGTQQPRTEADRVAAALARLEGR